MPLFVLLGFLFSACTKGQPILVDWSKELVTDGLNIEDTDTEPVKEDYFSVQTKGDTIKATALMLDHCVDEPIAVIECKEGIIYLTTKNTMAAEQYCPVYYKYTYIIYNPSGVDYEIVSK